MIASAVFAERDCEKLNKDKETPLTIAVNGVALFN
jgi:hypothetical protein